MIWRVAIALWWPTIVNGLMGREVRHQPFFKTPFEERGQSPQPRLLQVIRWDQRSFLGLGNLITKQIGIHFPQIQVG